MPSIPASIMRLTALPPPPPTPMTLMRAPVMGGSSSMKMLIPLAGWPSGFIFCNFLSPSEASPPRRGRAVILGCARRRHQYVEDYILCRLARQHTTSTQKIPPKRLRNFDTSAPRPPPAFARARDARISADFARWAIRHKPEAAAHAGLDRKSVV